MRLKGFSMPDLPIIGSARELIEKFQGTGSVTRAKEAGRKSISEKLVEIVAYVLNSLQQSTTTVAREWDVSTTTVKKYLKRQKFHQYKLILTIPTFL